MANGYHYLNGQFLEKDQCFMHVTDLGIQRSFAVFDYFTFIDQTPFYIDDYLSRFRNSVKKMDLDLPYSNDELKAIVSELISMNGTERGGIKFIYTGGYAPNGYDASEPNFLIMHLEFPVVDAKYYKKGIKLLLEEYIRDFPTAKTTDYFFILSLKKKLKEQEAFDVLYHKDGYISESSRSNFFMIDKDGVVCTTNAGILEGITRKKLIEACEGDIEIVQRPIRVDEIASAKEAFLTSSVKRVIPITQIGQHIIGNGLPGVKTLELRKRLAEFDRVYLENH
jgi:D-alanine transaminase/branched-chain amino acid aminotransferase